MARVLRWMAKKISFIVIICFIVSYAIFQISVLSENSSLFKIETDSRKQPKDSTGAFKHGKDFSQFVDDWVEVIGSERRAFLYSAFHDTRENTHVIRIISILQKKVKVDTCYVETASGETKIVRASVVHIREGWTLPYVCSFITCEYSYENPEDVPVKVAVEPRGMNIQQKMFIDVEIMDNRQEEGYMSICVKPFHYEFNRAVWLVEFIEMYIIMGANHFIFYNHTVGPDVQKVLDHYIDRGVATVLPWALPVISQKEIRTEGIFSALNDCNLRSVRRFEFAAFVDIDEFILPRVENSYPELLSSLGPHNEYIFQNVFFYLYWENDTRVDDFLYGSSDSLGSQYFGSRENGPYLITQYKTTRMKEPHPHRKRSKYISRPLKTIECGNHFVWSFANGKRNSLSVRSSEAISQHYRICEFGGFDCLNHPHEIDNTAHRWMKNLVVNVNERCRNMFPEIGTCPRAPPLGSPW